MNREILLTKANRLSAWICFLLVIIFIITGFAMTGQFGMDKIIGVRLADRLHSDNTLIWLLIISLTVHSLVCIRNALKRWKML